MLILSIDTCLQACSAALMRDGAVIAARAEPREKGHAERLAPLVAELLEGAGMTASQISRIVVTTGPGSFTGVRVGLAFARGLAVGRVLPVIGVTTLEALAEGIAAHEGAVRAALIDGRRGQVYGQLFAADSLTPLAEPFVEDPDVARRLVEEQAGGSTIVPAGSGTGLVFPDRADHFDWAAQQPDPVVLARLGTEREPDAVPPAAFYLRAPDAAPPKSLL